MRRRTTHLGCVLAIAAFAAASAAYGCSGSVVEADDVDGASPESDAADKDGRTSTLNAAEVTDDARTDASAFDSSQAEGASDAGDSGTDGGLTDAMADADSYEAGPTPPGPLSPAYVDYAINHVLITGQSNSVGNSAVPVLTTMQPFTNLMFDTGVMPMGTCDGNGCDTYQTPNAFVPLVQNDQYFDYTVETPANGLADEISHLAALKYDFGVRALYPAKHDVLASVHGRSGNTYWCLRKGFCPYNAVRGHASPFAQAMKEVTSAKAIAAAAGQSHVVRAVFAVHGESDQTAYAEGAPEFPLAGTDGVAHKIVDYSDALLEWQEDYESSVKAITGQVQAVPLFISGLSGWTTTRTSQIAQWQLDAHVRAPGKVVYVTPAYPLSVDSDCVHFSSAGERRLGEYLAKAYARVVFGGAAWEPVRPKNVARVGNVVTVTYHVPAPPLTLDTVHVTNPGDNGFDFVDNGTIVAIASVAVTAPDTVTITLGAVPSGVNMRLRYAQNQDTISPTRCIGPGTVYSGGARGNLRDSDATPSKYGYDLWNWGANFDVAIL